MISKFEVTLIHDQQVGIVNDFNDYREIRLRRGVVWALCYRAGMSTVGMSTAKRAVIGRSLRVREVSSRTILHCEAGVRRCRFYRSWSTARERSSLAVAIPSARRWNACMVRSATTASSGLPLRGCSMFSKSRSARGVRAPTGGWRS
jgi:hypothetical protein